MERENLIDIIKKMNSNLKAVKEFTTSIGMIITKNIELKEVLFKRVLDETALADLDLINCGFEGEPTSERVYDFVKQQVQLNSRESKDMEILYNSSLMNLIVYFEGMFSDMFKFVFLEHPEKLQDDRKYIYKEIAAFASFEEFKEYVIEKEIETYMYQGFMDWIDFFRKTEKIKIEYLPKYEKEIVEIIARRNLLVHNNGRINNLYLAKVDKTLTENLEKNQKLEIDAEYILKSINIVQKFSNLLLIELGEKYYRKEEYFSSFLSSLAFGFLEQENYELAEIIFEILKKKQNGIDPLSKVYAQINYWQCLKRTNRITLMNEEMSSIDFSLYKEKIVIGIYALKDEHQKVYDCLQDLYPDEISLARLKSWPIFKEFRNTIWYKVFMIERG